MLSRSFLYIAAVALLAAAIPLALRLVGPNTVYGWRTPATLADPGTWYRTNAVLGWAFIAAGVVIGAATLLTPMQALADMTWLSLVILVAPIVVAVAVVAFLK